ncbi:MAG: NfeD family protein [Campylobacter sp.]|uniref:NfeD family protein n=1 Tax=Campylobacter sp. TaxID=205 RepID=UPI002A5288F2|nr:NfeD family protein [Campylobacter sp.]MCI6340074.1 NfeD family protein [Campylobacter sp.]MDD7090529.1 NfeD family protein [Campylobacteraceae bacterium]MDY4446275.1 NfeD family protein [Campylobacter sp.]MDY5284804.1 NfeD family protein [Campylobacter sp.]
MISALFGSLALVFFIIELVFLDFSCFIIALALGISAICSLFIDLSITIWAVISALLAVIFFFTIRAPLKRFFMSKKSKDDFLDESGQGVVKDGMIYFKGTMWRADTSGLSEGHSVKVKGIQNGKIIIEKS